MCEKPTDNIIPKVGRRGWKLFHYSISQGLSLFDKFSGILEDPTPKTIIIWLDAELNQCKKSVKNNQRQLFNIVADQGSG